MISCRKLASIQLHISFSRRCDATMPLLSTEIISFFSFHAIFSVKIIKRNLSHSVSPDLKFMTLGTALFRLHFSHLSNSTNTICHEFLNYNFTKCPFFFIFFPPRLSRNITNHEYRTRCKINSKAQRKKKKQHNFLPATTHNGDAPEKL